MENNPLLPPALAKKKVKSLDAKIAKNGREER